MGDKLVPVTVFNDMDIPARVNVTGELSPVIQPGNKYEFKDPLFIEGNELFDVYTVNHQKLGTMVFTVEETESNYSIGGGRYYLHLDRHYLKKISPMGTEKIYKEN